MPLNLDEVLSDYEAGIAPASTQEPSSVDTPAPLSEILDDYSAGLAPEGVAPSAPADEPSPLLAIALQKAQDEAPDAVAKRNQVAKQLGISPALVTPAAMKDLWLKQNDPKELARTSPKLAKLLEDSSFAAVASDSIDGLGSIEKHLVNTGRSLAAAFPRMRAAISGAVYGVAENLATPRPLIPKSLLSDNAVKALEAADRKLGVVDSKPGLIEQAASKLAGVAKSYADAQTAKAEALAPDLRDANWVERGFHSGIESGATALPLLATEVLLGGRAKGKILAAGFSGQTLGQSYLKADDVTGREALTPSEKLQFATRDAMLEYYLGLLPSATLVAGATGKTGLVDMVKNFAMRELPSEQATTHLQDLNAWATLNPTKPFTEYMRERPDAALETLVATLVGGGIQVGAATGTAKALGAIRPKAPATEDADAAVQAHEALRAAAEAATANPLRTRDESAFHQAISSMSDDPDAISEVYVAPTALRDALTSSGVNIADIESKVPGLTAELAEAIDKGHDVRLKTADFLTYLAPTPAGEAILSGLRVAPGGMTYAESQEHYMNEVRGLAESASSDRVLSETEFNALSEAEKQLLTQPQPTVQPVEAAPVGDRRRDTARRKRIAEMSPEEMQRALLTSELTGLPNRRAYEDAVKAPVQGSIDADSLKWVNDNMSPESGDALLRGIGEALRAEGIEAYHISGDEFMTQGQSAEEIDAAMARVQARLKNAVIRVQKPDGSIIEKRGLEVTYGTGADKNEADYRLKESKRQRESAGLRAGRGEQPPGISKIAPAGQPDTGGDVPVAEQPAAEQPVAEQPVAEQSTGKRRLSYAEYVASHPNSRAAARATAQADARTIRRNLEAQLRIAGHSGTRAEVDARAVTEFYSTMAARLGISASELYRKYPLRIVKAEGQSSKAASPGDVTPAGIAHLLEKDNWAILTAENPGNTALSPAENAVRTERLKSQLRTAGYLAEEVRGRYGVDENESVSFLVYGITQADAQELGKAYGQEAILTRAGLVYQDGSVSPARGIKTFGTPPENFYTRVPRTGVVFSVDLNLDERIAPAYAQTNPETAPLYGLPDRVTVDGAVRRFGPSASIREVAKAYASAAGINYQPPRDYVRVDPDRAKRIADAFDAMPHNPKDPAVKAAYDALISETLAQWEAIKAAGLQVEFIEGADPYGNPRNAILDITENNHMWVYPTTAGFGTGAEVDTSDSPMLAIVPGETISGKPVRVNDIFRIVHDYFGHAKEGVGFRADGEENAWRSHSAMYSPLARKALATETRGQNSWLNYGPHGDRNRTAKVEDTVFAPQKVGLLPDWVVTNGAVDPVSVVGVHFSNTSRTELRGDKYGTGITGAEAKRLKFADPRLKSRISFYIDEGNGIKPEPGLGKARHDVPLNNLYDAKANPLGLPTKDPNEFEAAVIDAGFDGYYVAGAFSTQGAAVLLGRAAERVPTTGGSLFQGVRGEFDPSTLTIRLMSGADLSTVTHEAAHFYLEVLADMAAAEDAPKGIKDDFAKALAWFGISAETWYSLDTEGKREYHERWAESFELFTLEGKAPAVSLQPTFSQIRSWMLKVYLSVEQFLKINPRAGMLNDEIRGVFSRLLATEDAIAVAEQERGYADLLVAVAKADTEGAKAAAYRALGAAATQDAIDTLTARSMRDMKWLSGARSRKLKELQHKADEARQAVRAEVTTELLSQPVHAVRADLARKDGPKLNSAMLRDLMPMLDLKALAGKVSPKGTDPNIIATQYGFPSAEAMVSDILTLPSLQEEVDAITDRRMLERHSELADPIAVAQAVDAALHNEGRARFLATGLSILSKSPIPVRQLVRAAKDAAEQVINSKRLRDIRPDQYTAAEQRANKAVISAATDPKAAINAQREALLNHQLGRTAAEALDEVASARRRIMKLRKASIQKKMRGGYLEQLNALLDRFDLRDRMSVAALEKERTESLDAWIKNTAQNLSAIYPDIPGKILDESYRKNYRDMTLEEFREVVAAVEALETLARREEEQYQAIRGMKFADEKAAFLSRVREVYPEAFSSDGNPLPVRPELRKKYIPVGDVAERLYAEFISSETVANIMEGGTVGAVHESLIQRMSTGADERQRRLAAVIDLLKPALKKYSRKDKYLLSRKKIATIGNDELSRENVIVAALLWGNQEGRARLLNYGWDPEAVQAAFTKLQPKDLDLIEAIWDMFDTHLWPDLEALNKRTRGKAPPKVEAQPFVVGGRELRGGYFKLQYISDDVSPADPEVELEQLMSGGYGLSAKTAQGSSTERKETVAKRPRLDMGVLNEAVNETVNDLALREAVADTIRVLRDPDIRAVITNTQGPQAYQAFVQSIQDAAARPRDPSGFISKTLSLARRNTLAAMLSGLSTAVQNVSGFAAVVAREPRIAGPLAREIARLATTPWAVIAHAEANSKYYAERSKSYDQDVVQASDRLKLKNRWDVPLGVSLWALVGIDKLISAAVWNAAYALGNKDHSNDKNQAVAYADHLVRQTLGSGRKLDAAQIMRGTGAAGEIKAALTMFGGYFNAQLGLLVRHQALNKRLVNGNPVLASLLFAKNFALYVALPASLVALMFPKPEGDDDEEEDTAKQMAIATARYGTAMIPVVGRFGSSLIDYYVEDSPYRAFQLSPIESAAQSVVKTPDALASVLSGEGTTQDEKNAIMGLGYTFRLPGRLMANTWTAVKDINEGGAEGQEVSTILYGAPYRPE